MPSPKSSRNGNGQTESHRRGRSSSFHGHNAMTGGELRRPKTVSDLLSLRNTAAPAPVPEGLPRLPPKMLLKVTVLRSLVPVQVLMTPGSTVRDLIAAVLRQYVKEGRRPILPSTVASDFDLHYSQFSLESLDKEEKVIELGSRSFFLCPRKPATTVERGVGVSVATPFASCATEVDKVSQGGGFAWYKIMQFMM